MSIQINDTNVRQLPIKVRWLGWESNTYALHNEGWVIHTSEERSLDNYDARNLTLSLRDPNNAMIILARWRMNMYRYSDKDAYYLLMHVGIEAKGYMANDVVRSEHYMSSRDLASFDSLTLSNGMINIPDPAESYYGYVKDFKFFNEQQVKVKEIYLPPDSVDDCLNRALELQWPEHKKWKQEYKDSNLVDVPKIEARIYSLVA